MTQETGSRTHGMLQRILDGMLMTCSCSRSCQGISHNLINEVAQSVTRNVVCGKSYRLIPVMLVLEHPRIYQNKSPSLGVHQGTIKLVSVVSRILDTMRMVRH